MWNELPNDVVTAESIDEFKINLDKFWKEDPVMFGYEYQTQSDDE